ncbi:haloacid dehalogenase [Streptomyces sp. NPDC046939]|uniref:haloacid dehalogenase n=1 Tax=Streptomyces sp. NPDC046939 TaxID=3155376 RepID=UPI0033C364EF
MFAHIAAVFFSVDCLVVPGDSLTRLVEERLGLRGPASMHEAEESAPERWAGLPERDLHTQLADVPVLAGVEETTRWCWDNGLVPVVSSLTWAPIGAHLAERYGFHSYFGRPLDAVRGRFTGDSTSVSALPSEAEWAVRRADELGLTARQCAAVGACQADVPLFGSVGLGVAFNARAGADTSAAHPVEGDDLRAVIPALDCLTARKV